VALVPTFPPRALVRLTRAVGDPGPLKVLTEAEMAARARAEREGNGLTPAQREANLLGRSRRGGD